MRKDKSASEIYIEKVFVKESEERLKILADLSAHDKDGIQVSASEGHLLKFFSRMIGAKKIVEIGTLFGYSTSWFLESMDDQGKVWSFEKEELHYNFAAKHLQNYVDSKKLELFCGDALTELKNIEKFGPFDLVFIDANKSAYMEYFNWANQNLRSGGMIIADNTFLLGKVFLDSPPDNHKKAWNVMRELNQTLSTHPNYNSTMIATKEGLTIAQKN